MSDILKTAANSIPSFIWSDGEQPDATKYRNIFGAFSSTINLMSTLLGPVLNSNVVVSTKDTVISSNGYLSRMSDGEQEAFLNNANSTILNTFNLARILGPHAALNPSYLAGSVHLKDTQGIGYPLATNRKIQQLPFPPKHGYSFVLDDGARTWERSGMGNTVSSDPEGIAEAVDGYYFYIDEGGTLYSNATFGAGASLRYDLVIPNTASYLGSGYNCIPDLSLFAVSEEDRLLMTGGKLGCLEVSYESSSASASRWLVKLPEIISIKEAILTPLMYVNVDTFDPVGIYSAEEDKRFYVLNTDLYAGVSESGPTIIDNNLLALFNQATGETHILDWEVATDIDEDVPRSYYVNGPASLTTIFRNDADALLSSGGTNTKDFILFTLGTNVAQQLAQISANFVKHKHTGADSNRISHKDLLDAEGNLQGLGDQEGEDGGLDFRNYSRQLAYSNVKDNPHAQYLNRLGFLHGGSHGLYENIESFTKTLDLNMMHGDFLFYPIESVNSGTKPYKYASSVAYAAAVSAGNDEEKIYWDLINNYVDGIASDIATTFPDYRTHAMIFGWPNVFDHVEGEPYTTYNLGATKLYYEPWNFLSDTEYDNKGNLWTLKNHGFVPGDSTGLTGAAKRRGLSINWGNLFFGYREDIFGGLLLGDTNTEASASFRTSEFNVVTTANGQAGLNTNSVIKNGYAYRDGFAVKALEGSNIWLSVGGENNGSNALSSTDNPGSFALDVSLAGASDEYTANPKGIRTATTKRDRAAGAGILATPSLRADGSIPWVDSENGSQSIASLWDNDIFVKDDGDAYIKNSVLDIFNLATDYQTNNDQFAYIMPGTDDNIRMWTAGRPFIRGTYGINFCVSNNLGGLHSDFKTGYHLRDSKDPWGPEMPVIRSQEGSDHEYIHREFRFWGSNEDTRPEPSDDSLDNTVGGNINLLYNFGRDYNRFGITRAWSSAYGSLSGGGQYGGGGGVVGNLIPGGTFTSPWSNSRNISLGTSGPENYGSAIRQASFVDAFAGLRSDPLQPYIAEYALPFTAIFDKGPITSYSATGIDIEEEIKKVSFIIGSNSSAPVLADPEEIAGLDDGWWYICATNNTFNDIKLDGLIRGSEEILISNSYGISVPSNDRFPASLIDFNLKLNYFIGALASGSTGTGPINTPHVTPNKYYKRVIDGDVKMIPAWKASMSADANKIPIVMTDRNNPDTIAEDSYNTNSIIGYSSSIGLWPANTTNTTYRNKFPLFEEKYGANMGSKVFTLLLSVHDRIDESYDINSPVPYQIYIEAGRVYIKFTGTMNFKFMTSYHTTPLY
jgi:hypothetical protein